MDATDIDADMDGDEIADEFFHHCQFLKAQTERYRAAAGRFYTSNPEGQSGMILTIMELWVAVDGPATNLVPLLLEYDTGFPAGGLFDGLVLPKKEQLERLARIEDHLERRRQLAGPNGPPWPLQGADGSGSWSESSFAVRYGRDGGRVADMLARLHPPLSQSQVVAKTIAFEVNVPAVVAAWREVTLGVLTDLFYTHDPHSPFESPPEDAYTWDHPMILDSIDPRGLARLKLLRFRFWFVWDGSNRDSFSYKSGIYDSQPAGEPRPEYNSRPPRWSFKKRPSGGRRSVRNPYRRQLSRERSSGDQSSEEQTSEGRSDRSRSARRRQYGRSPHRRQPSWERSYAEHSYEEQAAEEKTFEGWSDRRRSDRRRSRKRPQRLRFPIYSYAPDTIPEVLREWALGLEHTSNEVIARQCECPHDMTLSEFRAFGHLRSGTFLQWQNVLVQLVSPSLNFNRAETWYLIMQASNEAGPRTVGQGALRDTHSILADERFGCELASGIEDTLDRIVDNWESWVSVCVLLGIATKLLSASASHRVHERCLGSLRRIRHMVMKWARQLIVALRSLDTEPEKRRCLGQDARLMSLICHATFDVGTTRLARVLSDSSELVLLVEASLRVAEHTPPPRTEYPWTEYPGMEYSSTEYQSPTTRSPFLSSSFAHPIVDVLVYRWRRLSYEVEPWLGEEIACRGNPCLDVALTNAWPLYTRGTAWARAPTPHNHVLVARSAAGGDSLSLQYDLLTGCLTVDGSPFSTLPPPYREHETYRRVFGDCIFTVVSSRMRDQGMRFSATAKHGGHEIHFGLFSDNELIVRSERNGRRYELIPHGRLDGDFPVPLLARYVHWLVLDGSGRVEFRPLENLWQTPEDAGPSWAGLVLEGVSSKAAARVIHRDHHIAAIDTRSKTARLVRDLFQKIERPEFIDMTFDRSRSVLAIHLPRYRLDFGMAAGHPVITSAQYKGYAVDADQYIGTLVGLENRLVLRKPCNMTAHLDTRLVLIPVGEISSRPVGVDARVLLTSIVTSRDPSIHIPHHAFDIDTALGRFRDRGAVHSRLFLCYLHAATSSCLPDPLTGRTGTDEALRILNSAAVQSMDRFTKDDFALLDRIGGLSPIRMGIGNGQSIGWPSSPVPADDAFSLSTQELLNRALQCESLAPVGELSSYDNKDPTFSWPHLNRRASARGPQYSIPATRRGGNDMEYREKTATARETASGDDTIADVETPFDAEVEAGRLARYMAGGTTGATGQPTMGGGLLYSLRSPRFLQRYPIAHSIRPPQRHRFSRFQGFLRVDNYPDPSPWWTRDDFLEPEFGNSHRLRSSKATLGDLCRILRELGRRRQRVNSQEKYKIMWFLAGLLFERDADLTLIQLLLSVSTARPGGEAPGLPLEKQAQSTGDTKVQTTGDPGGRPSSEHHYLAALVAWAAELPLIRDELDDDNKANIKDRPPPPPPSRAAVSVDPTLASIDDLFRHQQPPLFPPGGSRTCRPMVDGYLVRSAAHEPAQPALLALLDRLDAFCRAPHERKYVTELRESLEAFQNPDVDAPRLDDGFTLRRPAGDRLARDLVDYMGACRSDLDDMFAAICHALTMNTSPLGRGALPTITPMLLLERLSRRSRSTLPDGWLRCLVGYAVGLTELQRAERMVRAAHHDKELVGELLNVGHENWDPVQFPDWLLLEVETGILIRPVQKRVALAMIDPPGGRNRVMQLDMGEGKSSVIVPMVASLLADGSRLVRVVVAKPQQRQMMLTLTRAVGSLLHCRIIHLPFSRESQLTENDAIMFHHLCRRCAADGDILLIQPEHVLSLKLLGLERAVVKDDASTPLLALQHEFDQAARDIVDESDENLSPRFELGYTMGAQESVDLGPARWLLVQSILGLLAQIAPGLHREYPEWFEVSPRHDSHGFPGIRVIDAAATPVLADRLSTYIYDSGLPGFPHLAQQQPHVRKAMIDYMVAPKPARDHAAALNAKCRAHDVYGALLLLRGLLAHGILAFALQKRWRVGYGCATDDRRPPTGLAVPYRAKDAPALRSEFSQPDVVIVLTCLTYYYGGLRDDELFRAFQHLFLAGGPAGEVEYQNWIEGAPASLPAAFRELGAVNISDREQCVRDVFPHLRYQKKVIDYYLAEIVFAREMREYPYKLAESPWSLAEQRRQLTTGFSGTGDASKLLPLGIEPLRLPEQIRTDAAMLSRLLQPENEVRDVRARTDHGADLLAYVAATTPPIRVILDAGAQIVELSNEEAARHWLTLVPASEASAVVYFNEEALCVAARDGTTEPLMSSPYLADLGSCLVFLDQAHTRGTDLSLPNHYRAAVTLGPGLTKSRLVQACMRMRKLGRGQSVVLMIPHEVRRKVRAICRHASEDAEITVADVLCWSIGETWRELRKLTPLWAAQGERHQRQKLLWEQAEHETGYHIDRRRALRFLERESWTLQERYSPYRGHGQGRAPVSPADITPRTEQLARIRKRCASLEGDCPVDPSSPMARTAAELRGEHERELLTEAEEAREVARPSAVQPHKGLFHPDVEAFVMTGVIPESTTAFQPAFDTLEHSSVGGFLNRLRLHLPHGGGGLLVTTDFARTVKLPRSRHESNAYHRPVQWVATAPVVQSPPPADGRGICSPTATIVILSPLEANAMLRVLSRPNTTAAATLHLFAPRTQPATRSADDLTWYTTPPLPAGWALPRTQVLLLLLFSGQLYLRSYADYVGVCRILGIPHDGEEDEDGDEGENEDRNENENSEEMDDEEMDDEEMDDEEVDDEEVDDEGSDDEDADDTSNLAFFRGLLWQIRHDSADTSKSDIARLLNHEVLTPDQFSGRVKLGA